MGTPLEQLTQDMSLVDLLKLTEMLYNDVRTGIANAAYTDQETILACNAARIEINKCKEQGIGS